MHQCTVVSFITPNNYELHGLWFGSQKAKTGFIFVHGLSGSAFKYHDILSPLLDETTMALYFNNRGHDKIAYIRKYLPESSSHTAELLGEVHEVFTDCVDDIQGAIDLLKQNGVTSIYLVGHSTGCQKSIYYLSKNDNADVSGVVLICPISDYSFALANESPETLRAAVNVAKKLVALGKPHELMPLDISPDLLDAQRFLSLHTPDSEEEIFTYAQPNKIPATLQKVSTPTLVIFAQLDEYADRPANELGEWFKQVSRADPKIAIIKAVGHDLKGQEAEASKVIGDWVKR